MGRKKARDNAFKCIYQFEFCKDRDTKEILQFCYQENENDDEEIEYISSVVNGVKENIESIDNAILSNLKNWNIDRISKIDLAIIRLATFEILYKSDIPKKVSANEAVELAKTYGNNDSKNFVNGILAKIIKDKEDV